MEYKVFSCVFILNITTASHLTIENTLLKNISDCSLQQQVSQGIRNFHNPRFGGKGYGFITETTRT